MKPSSSSSSILNWSNDANEDALPLRFKVSTKTLRQDLKFCIASTSGAFILNQIEMLLEKCWCSVVFLKDFDNFTIKCLEPLIKTLKFNFSSNVDFDFIVSHKKHFKFNLHNSNIWKIVYLLRIFGLNLFLTVIDVLYLVPNLDPFTRCSSAVTWTGIECIFSLFLYGLNIYDVPVSCCRGWKCYSWWIRNNGIITECLFGSD